MVIVVRPAFVLNVQICMLQEVGKRVCEVPPCYLMSASSLCSFADLAERLAVSERFS